MRGRLARSEQVVNVTVSVRVRERESVLEKIKKKETKKSSPRVACFIHFLGLSIYLPQTQTIVLKSTVAVVSNGKW